jgi:uncharacterized repeat protein (TIGR01451 family)
MYNMKGGSSSLQTMAGSFVFILLCAGICAGGIPGVNADAPDHAPVMFRADPWHSGVNDDGGTRPLPILLWSYCRGGWDSSPAVADGVVYIGGSAFDAETGALIWNQQQPGTTWDSSPAIINGVVYVGDSDNNVYAFDAETGGVIWNYTTKGEVHSSPAVADGVVYIGSSDRNLYALDAGTGDLLWNYTLLQAVRSSPAVANGIVYVGDFNSNFYALDAETGGMIWNYTMEGAVSSSPAVANGIVYVGSLDSNLYAFDAGDGALLWNYTAGDRVSSSPAVTEGVVYVGSDDHNVYALDASTGSLLWTYTTGGPVVSSPTVANGVLYVGSYDENLYALDAGTGIYLWNYATGESSRSSPAVANGIVYVGSEDCMYAIGYSPGPVNLMLGKSGPAFYENASLMEYTLSYRNQGVSMAGDVFLTDYLPPSVEFVSGTGDPDFDNMTGTVTWYIGYIPPGSTGSQVLTVRIPSSVPYGTVLNNTANIVTSTPESRYDDNTASALTTLKRAWTPSGCSISPSVPDPWGNPTVSRLDMVTFSYNQTTCPPDTPVDIRIHIDDGGPDITGPMTGGSQYWSYTTTFYPRYGTATVTFGTPGCSLSGVTFPFIIEPAGYVYDTIGGQRIEGADVWLQWPDEEGEWVNVPTGLASPPMQPDTNPLTTDAAGQYQWEVAGGSYRVYVEAEGYTPAPSTMVNSPPQFSGLNIGLEPTTGKIWATSTPFGADIYLDGSDTGFVTSHELAGISAGQHEVGMKLAGYQNYNGTVTVTAGQTTTVSATLIPLSPEANFTADTTFGFIPMAVQFTDSSTGAQPLSYEWNFGDVTPNETVSDPVHTYTAEGTYNVTLTVSNSAGTSTLERQGYIVAMEPIIVGGDKAYYLVHSNVEGAEVYFNDWYEGTIENGTLLVQTCTSCAPVWTYTVKKCGYFPLTQENHQYPGKDEVVDLYANLTAPKEPLIADFTANVTEASAPPLTVGFTSQWIGIAGTWNWSFGDGTWSEEQDPVHTYTAPGAYTVSLTLTNSACQENTMVKQDYIMVGGAPMFKAAFTVEPVSGSVPLTVYCTDRSFGDPTTIVYDFGDGFKVTGSDVTHTYRLPGIYTITQTIAKYDPATRSLIKSVARKPDVITVFDRGVRPSFAAFSASPVTGTAPLTVSFTDETMGDPTFYSYDFGDGFTSTERNPVHTYRYPGVYTVSLTVMKVDPGSGTLQRSSELKTGLIVVEAA